MNNKHTHQYQRRAMGKDNSYIVYMCVIPNCGHYIAENLVVGRLSRCNYCLPGSVIIGKEPSGKILHKPKCFDCKQKSKRDRKDDGSVESFIEKVLS